MKRILPLLLIVLLAGAAVTAVVVVMPDWLHDLLSPVTRSSLKTIDQNLAQESYGRAQSLLDEAAQNAQTPAEWLSLLKRQILICQNLGRFEALAALSARAVEKAPGNALLQAVRLYAVLRTNEAASVSRQSELLRNVLKDAPPAPAFEGHFEGLLREAGLSALDQDWRDRDTVSSPEYFQAKFLLTGDPVLRQDAALLFAGKGELQKAIDLLLAGGGSDSDRLLALLAHDLGQWPLALSILNRLNAQPNRMPELELLLLQGDILLIQKRSEQAEILYRKIVQDFPGRSPVPYFNLALLAMEKSDLAAARALLQQYRLALADFPREGGIEQLPMPFQLLETELAFLLASASGRMALKAELLENPFAEFEILRMRLYPETFSLPRLWVLFNRDKTNSRVAEYLAASEIVREDYDKAREVLDIYEEKTGAAPWWLWQYRGLLHGLAGRYKEAVQSFGRVPERWRTASLYFDWAQAVALDTERADHRQEAMGLLTEALKALPQHDTAENRLLRSRIHTVRGGLSVLLGRLDPARAELGLAIELDSENLRARLLLKRVEETVLVKENR